MFTTRGDRWRFALLLVPSFLAWGLLSHPLLPIYARAVVPLAEGILTEIRPHGSLITFPEMYPSVTWQVENGPFPRQIESTSFRLLTYNLVLYLALLTALPRTGLVKRLVLLLSAFPLFIGFHIVDLLLIAESRMLTTLQPQHYAFWRDFDLWFVVVKFLNSFSVMALKQVFPVLVLWAQWRWLQRSKEQKCVDQTPSATVGPCWSNS